MFTKAIIVANTCLILFLSTQDVITHEYKKELVVEANPLTTECSAKDNSISELNRVGDLARDLEHTGLYQQAADCYSELVKGNINEHFALNILESIIINYSKSGMCSEAEAVIPKYEQLFEKLWLQQGETTPSREVDNPQLTAMRGT